MPPILTFILSLIGAVFGALSLGWNIAQWVLAGARPRIDLVVGALGRGGMTVGPPQGNVEAALRRLQDEGFTQPVIGVKVVNRGRAPARVEHWSLSCNGLSYVPIGESVGPDLPHDLPAGASVTWVTNLASAVALGQTAAPDGGAASVTVTAELGTGKVLTTKTVVRVA